MKKVFVLIFAFVCAIQSTSFAQSTLQIENGTNCPITLHLVSYDINSCNYDGFTTVTVNPGQSLAVPSAPNIEYLQAEFYNDPCSANGNYGVGLESDGLNGACYPCPSFGHPSAVYYNYCPNCQPFKAVWNAYCGTNNPHIHLYN